MSVKEIEKKITELSDSDFAELSKWFVEYHAKVWDQEIEKDLAAGRLDAVMEEAENEYNSGKAKSF